MPEVDENASNRPTSTTDPRRIVIVAAVLTVLVGFGLGFVLAGARGSGRATVAAGPATSAPTPPPSTTTTTVPVSSTTVTETPTTGRATTAVPTTTVPVTTPATTATAATSVPATLAPTVPTTRRPTPSTTPPTSYAPPRVVVTYPADASGRFVVPRTGASVLTVTNQGGLASQFIVTGSGFSASGGGAPHTLEPGQSVGISISAPATDLSKTPTTGIISVLGATNSSIPFVIPGA